jgi:WD40 repeat protein
VLTASSDHTARLWDAASGAALAVLRGHDGVVWSAVFDPSGSRVLTASSDHTARLWDAASGAALAVLRGHESGVGSAVFDASGACVLTASDDHTARIWRVFPTVAALVAHTRAIMPRALTQQQRKQFFLE